MKHKISNSKSYRYIFEKYIFGSSMNIQIWIKNCSGIAALLK